MICICPFTPNLVYFLRQVLLLQHKDFCFLFFRHIVSHLKDIIKISMHYITCSAACRHKSLLSITYVSRYTNFDLTNHIDTILRSTFIQLRGIIYHFVSLLTSKPFSRFVYQISVAKRSIRNWIDLVDFQS